MAPIRLMLIHLYRQLTDWKAIPSWYLVGTLDKVIPPYVQIFMAERANAQIVQVKAPHPSMISDPNAVEKLIETAAQAVLATP